MSEQTVMRVISETELEVYAGVWWAVPAEWKALLEWCKAHGMDPDMMPVDQVIVRDVERCRVVYDGYVCGDDGHRVLGVGEGGEPVFQRRRVHAQGETPPLPFPDLILRHIRPIPRPETA